MRAPRFFLRTNALNVSLIETCLLVTILSFRSQLGISRFFEKLERSHLEKIALC